MGQYSSRFYGLAIFSLLLVSCATIPSRKADKWKAVGESEEFKREKGIYMERLGGAEFCWAVGIDEFLKSSKVVPNPKCFYPASSLIVENDGIVIRETVLQQNLNQLKVLQVTSEGFVVKSPYLSYGQVIFIHKTDESALVDGSYLDGAHDWKMYQYAGPVSYATLAGSKTVHSFRKIPRKRFDDAVVGLKVYEATREFFIENRLWGHLEK